MSVRLGLLALLAEAPTHGYGLKTAFERRTGASSVLNIGQVYTTLKRLQRDGLVEERGGRGDRREYGITESGRQALESWFSRPVLPEAASRDELTIKVLIAAAAPDVDLGDLLQRQRRVAVEQLQAYTRRKAQSDPNRDLAYLILIDALIFRTEAEIRWLDAVEARVQARDRGADGSAKEGRVVR